MLHCVHNLPFLITMCIHLDDEMKLKGTEDQFIWRVENDSI